MLFGQRHHTAQDIRQLPIAGELRPAPDVVSATHDGEVLLLDVGHGRYHRLNRTASLVWELLDARTDFPSIVERVCTEFELPPGATAGTVEQDVAALLGALQQTGLLVSDHTEES